jgi:hypothetical protein
MMIGLRNVTKEQRSTRADRTLERQNKMGT